MSSHSQKSLDLVTYESSQKITIKSSDSSTDLSKNRRKRKPKKIVPAANDLNPDFSPNDSKFDSDGCETIDKIAQMVSNITRSAENPLPNKSALKDVEIQLEEMFAESKKDSATPPQQQQQQQLPIINAETENHQNELESNIKELKPKKPRKKRQLAQKKRAVSEIKSKSGKINLKKDKDEPKKTKNKESGGKAKVKNDAAPYLQVQEDGTFQIINQTTNGEDDNEKSNSKPKKPIERHKNIARRIQISADKRDSSWVCVFCKFAPHKFKLGDLFGPYIISTTSPEYALCLEDPEIKQVNRNKFDPVTHSIVNSSSSSTKKKSKYCEDKEADTSSEVFNGMSKVDDTHYEIWFHEDCISWAPGTYIIGSKINNLEAAVWHSTRHRCSTCQKNGAMMACLHRGCKKEAHFACARKGWRLFDDFKTFCDQHLPSTT